MQITKVVSYFSHRLISIQYNVFGRNVFHAIIKCRYAISKCVCVPYRLFIRRSIASKKKKKKSLHSNNPDTIIQSKESEIIICY